MNEEIKGIDRIMFACVKSVVPRNSHSGVTKFITNFKCYILKGVTKCPSAKLRDF